MTGLKFIAAMVNSLAAPRAAIINAWGLLEYQLNVASGWIAPDQQHGWPQVARNLGTWDTLRTSLTSLSGAPAGGRG